MKLGPVSFRALRLLKNTSPRPMSGARSRNNGNSSNNGNDPPEGGNSSRSDKTRSVKDNRRGATEPQDRRRPGSGTSTSASPSPSTPAAEVKSSSASPLLGGVKRSRSQVFDPEETDLPLDQARLDQPSRRKSSWAFWKSEAVADPSSLRPDSPSNRQQDSETANAGADAGAADVQDETAHASNTVKSVVVDGEEEHVASKERTHSWSFWSYATKDNLKAKIEPKPKTDMPPIPDVVKSNVSKSNNYTAPSSKQKPTKKNAPATTRPNIIVPQLEDTLPLFSTHNLLIGGVKRLKKMLGYTDTRDTNLFRKEEPTIFKRVLIIGVHGFFPTRMIRPIIGEPTGTSMKFAQVGETAVLSWAKENNLNIEIQKIALEKEGKIFDRVEFFFDILKNSANDIKKADFIFVCSHSQGCPVSVILMSKLLDYGIIDENKKIGILGMAGINIGPFYGMDRSLFMRAYSTIENESLLELFQFQNFESLQSRKYIESLRNLVRHDVKITFVGSIDDQLVPLYSAIALHVQHPNLFKAVYIDGSTNTPDFVARIIKLSCMLQNIGSTDHDVIKEISSALAGPITGGGHSRIYNDLKVYKLALDFILKTESSNIAIEQPVRFKPFDIKKLGSGANPFNLPWCARGLFFEVSKRLPGGKEEIQLVFREFEEWEPESKALKDVKYRLNGIRAKF